MDGCPFVLLPDTAEDTCNFLRAVLCFGFFNHFPASTSFPILSSVLCMSPKYEADALWKRALIHLSRAYPTTLDEWDDLPDELPWDGICQCSFDRAIITGDELSNADKVNCIKGLRYLETTGAANVLEFLLASYSNCSTRARCMESRQAIRCEVETEMRKYDAA
ncbi:hypothetical protein B0H14DRAFT_3468968 [Mycena olivaceomarginata]|nr:hypothetical protein B0H14DRAFT_3468968 [Mycena olivaceomarginata]